MTFSFFSNKKSSPLETLGTVSPSAAAIRTMRDDMEDIKHGKTRAFPESSQESVSPNIPQDVLSKQPVNPFSEEGEKLFQMQVEEAGKSAPSPFGVTSASKMGIPGRFPRQPSIKKGLAPTMIGGHLLTNQSQKRKNVWFMSILIIAILLLAFGGAYYYFFVRGGSVPEVVAPQENIQTVPEETTSNPPKELPYALDKPNYLSLNTETVSPLDIQKSLSETTSRIKEASITGPVEFLVTDQNNNPLAFSRFAFLLKLDLQSDMLALIDETFSLYAYNDAGSMRLGLVLTFKDPAVAPLTIPKIESTLPTAFQALLLEQNVIVPKSATFKGSMYTSNGTTGKEFSVRYANIDVTQNLSLDYTIADNHWYLGLSKNTLRAILDANTK